jgi:hypothetical protein
MASASIARTAFEVNKGMRGVDGKSMERQL